MEQYLATSDSPDEVKDFTLDVRVIKWKDYVMNHAYGVKHYILNEESVLPSMGYNDALVTMSDSDKPSLLSKLWSLSLITTVILLLFKYGLMIGLVLSLFVSLMMCLLPRRKIGKFHAARSPRDMQKLILEKESV